ncbi:MAG: hypothetical protein KDB61_12415, partial [Planctomycetes bacterium]|nr:hypothetical protein [Planctomycetota bacterium]
LVAARSELRKQGIRLATVEEQQEWLQGQVSRLAERILAPTDVGDAARPMGEWRVVIERMHAALHKNETEMTWRRAEMKRAQAAPSGFFTRLGRKGVYPILRNWDLVPEPAGSTRVDGPPTLGDKEIPAVQPADGVKSTPVEPKAVAESTSSLEAKQ